MIVMVNYGVGNLFSLERSFNVIGQEVVVSESREIIEKADKIILPGVGAFGDASQKLKDSGLGEVICERAKAGVPILGICLGMQLLFEKSSEYGENEGLGLIKGRIDPIAQYVPRGFKIPHIGWNALNKKKESKLFKYLSDGDYVYFVHSFCAVDCEDSVTAVTDYGAPITACVESGNVMGCQFHPEKSGKTGLNILRAFCEVE